MKKLRTILTAGLILYVSTPYIGFANDFVPKKCISGKNCISIEILTRCTALYTILSRQKSSSKSSMYKTDSQLMAALLFIELESKEEVQKVIGIHVKNLLKEIESNYGKPMSNRRGT